MYELKRIGKVFTSKFVGTGPSSYKKRIYRAAVSQSLRNTGLEGQYSYNSIISLTSVLYGDGWLTPRPGRFTPGTHCTGGWVGPRVCLDGCEKSCPSTGILPTYQRVFTQSTLSRFTIPLTNPESTLGNRGIAPLILSLGTMRR